MNKPNKNKTSKDDYRIYFNPMLNKTRVDNLPPLQELSVFEKSFESKRKQTACQQQLRSRSKNFYNLESGTYATGSAQNELNNPNRHLEESKSSVRRTYKSPARNHKERDLLCKAKKLEKKEVIVDSSISVVSGAGGSNKELIIKTGNF